MFKKVLLILCKEIKLIMGLVFNKEENPNNQHLKVVPDVMIPSKHNARQSSIRIKSQQEMPDVSEVERRFTKVLVKSI